VSDQSEDNLKRVGRGQRTRERILEVAEELIARHGVEGFELKDVAAKVGIRSPSIFAHFKGREDLAEAVARRVGEAVVEQFPIEAGEPEQVLRKAVSNLVAHLARNPAHVRILLADLGRHREVNQLSGSAEQVLAAASRVKVLLDLGTSQGAFRKVRPDQYIAFMLGGILSSIAWYGWDQEGTLQGPLTVGLIQRDAEEMAVRFLIRGAHDRDDADGHTP
jgi:AcrR family transcriptional regulator